MRYVAIDLGDKRTGLAVGDSETRVVSPLSVVEVGITVADGTALLEALARAVEAQLGPARPPNAPPASSPWRLESPGELVVGLPLNMDGTEGPRSRLVRAFARRIEQRTGRPVRFQDERLTSAEAEWSLAGSGLTHQQKKERRDGIAAAAILNDYIAILGRTPAP